LWQNCLLGKANQMRNFLSKIRHARIAFLVIVLFAINPNTAYAAGYESTINFASTGDRPFGIVVDSAGNIYTANHGGSTVTKITPRGESSNFSTGLAPYYLTIDSAGNVYTANYGDSTVTKITPAGVVVTEWAETDDGPYPITIDAAGNIFTGNYSAETVSKITPDGTSSTIGSIGLYVNAINVDSAGNIFTADRLVDSPTWSITKTTPGGVSSVFISTGANVVETLNFDLAGNLYVVYNADKNITKISPEGVSTIVSLLDDRYFGQMVIDFLFYHLMEPR
jgi:streptogramin lyase